MQINAPTIHIENACLRYGEQTIFSDLNLILPTDKTTCLLGSSGVGKTSLLRLIAGFIENDPRNHCSAIISTDDLQNLDNRIAYLAQNDLLFPWLSVIDNVLSGFRIRGFSSVDKKALHQRAEFLLEEVGLLDAKNKIPSQLSGGMRQRVALARTLMEDRPVVLMDEPFSALDVITRLQLQELAAKLLANKTVLFITHDPLEALRLGDQILVLARKPARIVKRYTLTSPIPRSIHDTELLNLQADIIDQLMQHTPVS